MAQYEDHNPIKQDDLFEDAEGLAALVAGGQHQSARQFLEENMSEAQRYTFLIGMMVARACSLTSDGLARRGDFERSLMKEVPR